MKPSVILPRLNVVIAYVKGLDADLTKLEACAPSVLALSGNAGEEIDELTEARAVWRQLEPYGKQLEACRSSILNAKPGRARQRQTEASSLAAYDVTSKAMPLADRLRDLIQQGIADNRALRERVDALRESAA